MTMISGHDIGMDVVKAMKLPERTKGFVLRAYVDEIVTMDVEYLPTDEILPVLKRFMVMWNPELMRTAAVNQKTESERIIKRLNRIHRRL